MSGKKWAVVASIIVAIGLAVAWSIIAPSYQRAQEYQNERGWNPVQKPR